MVVASVAQAEMIASEPFYYAHGTRLENGIANGGTGWAGGWEQMVDDGLSVIGAQVVQRTSAESTRELANPFQLSGASVYYFSFIARTDESGRFSFDLKQTDPGPHVRWAFARNRDGSITVRGAGSSVSSEPGAFVGGREYLVVSKFEASSNTAHVKLFDTSNPGNYHEEPGAWDLAAGGSTGVTIDRLDLRVLAGTVSVDEVRIATSYEEVLPELRIPSGTFIFKVEQPVTSDPNRWTYVVEEKGDYQIGLAWVETESGGDAMVELLKNGLERIRALYAPAGEVTRFETRIENLYPGDEITVKITPDGSTYRAGYEIALTTPTFDGLPVFDVESFGAAGDGVTDDMDAIRAAVTEARHAGGGVVRFDGVKTYRVIGLSDSTIETVFDLFGARDIKIEGRGATLLLHPPDRLADLHFCENVQIDGLTIDYDPIPYYQGTITNIDVENMTIDIDVPERYPEPLVGAVAEQDQTGLGPFFGRSFIPDFPGARSGRGMNIYVESTAINGGPRQIRIQVPDSANNAAMKRRVQDAYDNNATEFVVPHLLYGHRNGSTRIYGCSRVKLSNLHFVCMAHFWLNIIDNTGPVTLSNVDLKMTEPETELLASFRDGMHIKNSRWGVLIEEGDWDGAAMYDDLFAIYSRRQVVVSVTNNVATLTPSYLGREIWLWQPGDWVSFWSSDQGVLKGMTRVIGARLLDLPYYELTLESIPAGVLPDDIVLHEESLNRGTLVRNCQTYDVGTKQATTRLRGTDMRFENNWFEEFDFRLEWSDALGTPRARDVVVENTYFRSLNGRLVLARALGVLFKNCVIDGLDVQVGSGAEDIYFEGVEWINMSGDILNVANSSHVWLFGNSTCNGSAAGLPDRVSVDGSSTVTYAVPAGYPAPGPDDPSAFGYVLVPEADAYVRDGTPNTNYGASSLLQCKTDAGGSFTRQSYLRFDLSPVRGSVERAVLRLYITDTDGTGDTHTIHAVMDDEWEEATITWNHRPAPGKALDSAAPGGAGDWLELDVTGQVAEEIAGNRLFSAVLISNGAALVQYASREASAGIRPELVVETSWLYGAWAARYGLVEGPQGDDDSDGVKNIVEYAFGGDPTDATDTGYGFRHEVVEQGGEDWLTVSHARRSGGNVGLRYSMETTTNLLSGIWIQVDQVDTLVNALGPGLDLVTGRVPVETEQQQFIRLKVESE